MTNFQQDTLFKKPQKHVSKFSFNQNTVDAFPDMIQRSVPGYSTIISECGFIARQIVQLHNQHCAVHRTLEAQGTWA